MWKWFLGDHLLIQIPVYILFLHSAIWLFVALTGLTVHYSNMIRWTKLLRCFSLYLCFLRCMQMLKPMMLAQAHCFYELSILEIELYMTCNCIYLVLQAVHGLYIYMQSHPTLGVWGVSPNCLHSWLLICLVLNFLNVREGNLFFLIIIVHEVYVIIKVYFVIFICCVTSKCMNMFLSSLSQLI